MDFLRMLHSKPPLDAKEHAELLQRFGIGAMRRDVGESAAIPLRANVIAPPADGDYARVEYRGLALPSHPVPSSELRYARTCFIRND